MTEGSNQPEPETPLTKEEALCFLKNPSERNKQKAFLLYYGEEGDYGGEEHNEAVSRFSLH